MNKQQARETGLSARAAVSAAKRASYDAFLFERMKEYAVRADMVGCFVSMRDEPDTLAFLNWCFDQNIPVAVPKITGNTLVFSAIHSTDDLKPGVFGVLEPDGSHAVDLMDIDLMFVPLSSFDSSNQRTGYGKGYYDSVLRPSMKKVGIAYPEQRVDFIEADPWDIRLDEILVAQ